MPAILNPGLRTSPEPVVLSPSGMRLAVHHISYGVVDVEDVLAGRAQPLVADLSEDGRGADTSRWHEGPQRARPWDRDVYVERWELRDGVEVLAFHGWVDAVTRRLVQAG